MEYVVFLAVILLILILPEERRDIQEIRNTLTGF